MDIRLSSDSITQFSDHAIIAFVPTTDKLPAPSQALNEQYNNLIQRLKEQKDFEGKAGSSLVLPQADGTRLILIGMGKPSEKVKDFTDGLKAAAKGLKSSVLNKAVLSLEDIEVNGKDSQWMHQQLAHVLADSLYRFTECKSKSNDSSDTIEAVTVLYNDANSTSIESALQLGKAIANGMALTKTLGDLPGNVATPSYLAEQAEVLNSSCNKMTLSVIDEDEMEALGMGSFLSVSKGSIEPGKIVCMNYKGGKTGDAPHVLVGKGVTFDTGGISLKPGAGMDEMKYDMCGAASVLGTMKAIIELDLAINFVGVIACAENMPSGHASKPGDIVTAMNGTTIEILNTDAEGRLVLCDALTYTINTFKPATIVDIATLTGACMMALGGVNSGLMTQDESLAKELLSASGDAHDKVWRLPLEEEYQELLDSNFADIANIGGRLAGATTAACFLSRFTEGQRWAHLDIAGTAWVSGGKSKGASGRPVPLLVNYLVNKA